MIKNNTNWHRNVIAFCLTLAIFVSSSMVALAAPEKKSLMGELTVSGQNINSENAFVTLNGERAFSGRTFFSAGNISTSENTTATIKLGKLGFINLAPNSALNLSFTENSISGKLTAGQVKVFNNEGVNVDIQTADGAVNNDKGQTGIFTVDVQSGMIKATADKGSVYLNNGKTTVPVQTGQTTADDTSNNSPVAPLIVFAAIVATAAIYVITKNGNNTGAFASPTR